MPPIFERLIDNIEGVALVWSQYQAHSDGMGWGLCYSPMALLIVAFS